MVNSRSLLPMILLALLNYGCQMGQSSRTVNIPTAETPADEALSKLVLERLLAEKKAELTNIKVVSNNGKVYLSGTVNSLNAREQAIKIAWQSPGVQAVVNGLQVQK